MFALICMCGGLGAVTRFVLNTSIQRWWNRAFPLSTFIINVLATFFAGVAAAAYFYQTADHSSYLLFVTGFLGVSLRFPRLSTRWCRSPAAANTPRPPCTS